MVVVSTSLAAISATLFLSTGCDVCCGRNEIET